MTDWASVLYGAFAMLRKNAGDSGDIGDTDTNALLLHNIPVSRGVTNPKGRPVTPVTARRAFVTGVTGRERLRGDKRDIGKSVEFESVASVGTGVTSVTAEIQRPVHPVLQRLQGMSAPACFGAETWRQLILDASRFFEIWSKQADLLGWTDKDLVGVHPSAPAARYDSMGLLPLIRGAEVVDLQRDRATIRSRSGSLLVYLKRDSNSVPLYFLT